VVFPLEFEGVGLQIDTGPSDPGQEDDVQVALNWDTVLTFGPVKAPVRLRRITRAQVATGKAGVKKPRQHGWKPKAE